MKYLKILIVCIGIGWFLNSCCEKADIDPEGSGYLVFGQFYGFCIGDDCVQIFKLEHDNLLEDTKKEYPGRSDFYEGSYVGLDNSHFEQVKDLIDYFPEEMLNEVDTVFGCPDCMDQGGMYIEYNFNGIRKFWIIDNFTGNVPAYLHDFMEKVNEKIDLINN